MTPITLNATASSGLTAGFVLVSGPATLTGNSLTLTGVGDITVRAIQTGDQNHEAATPVERSFHVTADPPAILSLSPGQMVVAGTNLNLLVTASGTAPLVFQWRWGGDDLAGQSGAQLQLNGISLNQGGDYRVIITNVAGAVTSAPVTLTVASSIILPPTNVIPSRIRSDGFVFDLLLQSGRSYQVQKSLNHTTWVSLTNFTSTEGTFRLQDMSATGRVQTFYRVLLLP